MLLAGRKTDQKNYPMKGSRLYDCFHWFKKTILALYLVSLQLMMCCVVLVKHISVYQSHCNLYFTLEIFRKIKR